MPSRDEADVTESITVRYPALFTNVTMEFRSNRPWVLVFHLQKMYMERNSRMKMLMYRSESAVANIYGSFEQYNAMV